MNAQSNSYNSCSQYKHSRDADSGFDISFSQRHSQLVRVANPWYSPRRYSLSTSFPTTPRVYSTFGQSVGFRPANTVEPLNLHLAVPSNPTTFVSVKFKSLNLTALSTSSSTATRVTFRTGAPIKVPWTLSRTPRVEHPSLITITAFESFPANPHSLEFFKPASELKASSVVFLPFNTNCCLNCLHDASKPTAAAIELLRPAIESFTPTSVPTCCRVVKSLIPTAYKCTVDSNCCLVFESLILSDYKSRLVMVE